MPQTVPDGQGGETTAGSAADVAAELLGEESTSTAEEEATEESEDPIEEVASTDEGDELSADELEELAEETTGDTTDKGLQVIKDLVDSAYNGDAEAFVKGWHENNKRMKEFSEKLDSLNDALQAGAFTADSDESDDFEVGEVEADADVTYFTDSIKGLGAEIEAANQSVQSYMTEAGKVGLKIENLQGRLEEADESKVPELKSELAALKAEMRENLNEASRAEKEVKARQQELRKEERSLKQAEKLAEKQRSDAQNNYKQTKAAERKLRQETGTEFQDTVASLFDKHKVPESAQRSVFLTLRDRVGGMLRELGDGPKQDIKALTEAVGKDYFAIQEQLTKARLSKTTKTKTATRKAAPKTTPSPSSPATKNNRPRHQWSQAEWEAYNKRVSDHFDRL